MTGRHVLGRVVYQDCGEPPALCDGAPRAAVHMVGGDGGPFCEIWLTDRPVRSGLLDGLAYGYDGEFLFCAARVGGLGVYRDAVRAAYGAAFELVCRLGYTTVFRMWNLVGGITRANAEGLENYRDFCIGRAGAFEEWSDRIGGMPAATGVGSLGDGVDFYFLARRGQAVHLESSRMTPAYRYPHNYGPSSPSFARATYLVPAGQDETGAVFVSGTSSVIGDATMYPGDIAGQCDVTLGNIEQLISRENLIRQGIDGGYRLTDLRSIKVYVRDRSHLSVVRARCAGAFPGQADIAYLNVDLCRPDLLVELEGICR